jgi:hypothetical protein
MAHDRFDFLHGSSMHTPLPLTFDTSVSIFGGKENMQPGYLHDRVAAQSGGFPPHAFHKDMANPLMFHTHSHTYAYGQQSSYQGDFKPVHSNLNDEFKSQTSSFDGSFRPVMQSISFHGLPGPQGFPYMTSNDMVNDMSYDV